jgi:hypothetical protein
MPNVHEQNGTDRAMIIVPGFVLKAVVEDGHFALVPLASGAAYTQASASVL